MVFRSIGTSVAGIKSYYAVDLLFLNYMKRSTIIVLHRFFQVVFTAMLLVQTNTLCAQTDCPRQGSAKKEPEFSLNVRKNKPAVAPAGEASVFWDINKLINAPPHEDSNEFMIGEYVCLLGYLISYTEEGPESCNCKQAVASEKTGDVHMYIGLEPGAPKSDCVIVEITPSFKKMHPDYDKYFNTLVPLKISGYLLYDFEHRGQAENTCNACGSVWRKTCWELHPVVSIVEQP